MSHCLSLSRRDVERLSRLVYVWALRNFFLNSSRKKNLSKNKPRIKWASERRDENFEVRLDLLEKFFLLEKFPRGPSPDKPLAETDDELALIWPEIIASLYKHFFYKHLGTHYGLIERLI